MAERRMFAKTIIDSDAFLEMPISARLLYYDLSMRADDDGFNNSPNKVMRLIGATKDDMNILIARKFVIPFESGVVVIKHWKIHNYIRKDTYKETNYKEEKATLEFDENNAYRISNNIRQLPVDEPSTQVRIGKDSIGKVSIDEDRTGEERKKETFGSVASSYTSNSNLLNSLQDYIEMRRKDKKFTIRALKLNLGELDKLTTDDEVKIKIVDQSIMNSWKGFYPLKQQKQDAKEKPLPAWYTAAKEEEANDTKEEHLKSLRMQYEIYSKYGPEDKLENVKLLYKDLTGRNIEEDVEGETNE